MEFDSPPKVHTFLPTLTCLFGCRFDVLVHLLWQNRTQLRIRRGFQIFWLLLCSLILFPFCLLEELFAALFIYPKPLAEPPLFVLGHWRSGTTYLHNLLCCDPALRSFDAIDAYTPNNCLLLSPPIKWFLKEKLGQARYMDNMDYGVGSPSEECFAVANRTTKGCMNMLSFPTRAKRYIDTAFVDELPLRAQRRISGVYRRLYKKVNFRRREKHLVLKSPDNTCHAGWLAREYPNSKFIHIYRNPYKSIRSTINMIDMAMTFMPLGPTPPADQIEDEIIDLYARMHRKLFQDMEEIGPERLAEVRFEDFVQDPVAHLERVYRQLDLPGFEAAKPYMEAHVKSQANYKNNTFARDPGLIRKINEKAAFVFEHYGYEMEEPTDGLSDQAGT